MMTRREMLLRSACGFGAVAFSAMSRERPALAPPVRAKRVIFLYMDGGPSQVDTFDPKPRLDREHGKPIGMDHPPTQFNQVGTVLKSPWKFTRHGESGIPVSALFPHVARHVDKLCVVRSMTSRFPEHTSANFFLHTGWGHAGRPSMGSWVDYGLGEAAKDLPGFVVLNGGLIPPGGLDCFSNGFLPASFQGSVFRAGPSPVPNVVPARDLEQQRRRLDLVRDLDRERFPEGGLDEIDAAISNRELAFRMQTSVPGLLDVSGETAVTRKLYGLDDDYEHTRTYGTMLLLARRLAERGVRFIEVTCPDTGHDRWDQHSNLHDGHRDNSRAVDRPIAGLLEDLEGRGLLDDTLVVWAGEFGRTPMAQGSDGRDHNPHGFTVWLAGGGVKAGHIHGATDEYGYFAVDGKAAMHDLHATMLHLLGHDHRELTFRFSGRDMRLTDVHGELIHGIIA